MSEIKFTDKGGEKSFIEKKLRKIFKKYYIKKDFKKKFPEIMHFEERTSEEEELQDIKEYIKDAKEKYPELICGAILIKKHSEIDYIVAKIKWQYK